MEAMLVGLPCVATHVGGNHDLLDPDVQAPARILPGEFHLCSNGILVAPDDPIGLKNALEFFIGSESVRTHTGVSARNWIIENVLLETVADKYLDLYGTLLQ